MLDLEEYRAMACSAEVTACRGRVACRISAGAVMERGQYTIFMPALMPPVRIELREGTAAPDPGGVSPPPHPAPHPRSRPPPRDEHRRHLHRVPVPPTQTRRCRAPTRLPIKSPRVSAAWQ